MKPKTKIKNPQHESTLSPEDQELQDLADRDVLRFAYIVGWPLHAVAQLQRIDPERGAALLKRYKATKHDFTKDKHLAILETYVEAREAGVAFDADLLGSLKTLTALHIAITARHPSNILDMTDLYRDSLQRLGFDPASVARLAASPSQLIEEISFYYPHYAKVLEREGLPNSQTFGGIN